MAYYDFTGVCPCCGGTDLWDDNGAYGCDNPQCKWSRPFGPRKKPLMDIEQFERIVREKHKDR